MREAHREEEEQRPCTVLESAPACERRHISCRRGEEGQGGGTVCHPKGASRTLAGAASKAHAQAHAQAHAHARMRAQCHTNVLWLF